MSKKLQQYYIIKVTSTTLKHENYNISCSLKDARKNGELVSIGESQLLRSLFLIKNKKINQEIINNLIQNKKIIKNKKSSQENIKELINVDRKLDDILFVPEIVSVVVENITDYKRIATKGFYVNGKKFVRLLCGAGQARRNTVLFVEESIEKNLKAVLQNGFNKNIQITPAKYNAYFALCSSATIEVREPYYCVIPDCEISRVEKVDYITEVKDGDDLVEEKEIELPFNLFDGMGIISPRLARQWAEDLELDYLPSTFIIRNNFMKGMVAVIDFHKYSDEIGTHIIRDAWGKDVNVRDMDLILTTSQFKMWNAYDSIDEYKANCKKNNLTWGVSRVSPKQDFRYVFSNYQFLQAENLSDENIDSLCEKTANYFNNIISDNIDYTLLYLLGKNSIDYDSDIISKIDDNITKSLILNNSIINDPYVRNHITKSLRKKIKESYIGNLLLDGNYQTMISDPYAFMEYMFGKPVNGLLSRGQHYSNYWNQFGVSKVVAMRAPLTWRSEVNTLELQNNTQTSEWYKYIRSGIIYNVHGCDSMIHADSDFDGDLVMTTSEPELIEGAMGGLPITYSRNRVAKSKVIENSLWKSDAKSFDSKIGFITNCSTTMYAMLPKFSEDSPEYKELIRRLKICRKEQGNQIDKAKGLIVKPFPKKWTKKTYPSSDDEIESCKFHNSIVIDKRPYFMRWLYPNYNNDLKKHDNKLRRISDIEYSETLEEILSDKDNSKNKDVFRNKYYNENPLLFTSCVMNKICWTMEKKLDINSRVPENNFDHGVLVNDEFRNENPKEYGRKFKAIQELAKKYRSGKQILIGAFDNDDYQRFKTIEQYAKSIRQEAYSISSNIQELASLAVDLCYTLSKDSKSFVWNVFGSGIVENVRAKRQDNVEVPFMDEKGDITYLGNHYTNRKVNAGDDYDNF